MKSFHIYWTFFLLLFSTIAVGQTITYSKKQASIKQLLREVTKQTGYSIFYQDTLLKKKNKFDVNFKNASLEEVMKLALADLPLTYKISGQNIVFYKKEISVPIKTEQPVLEITVQGRIVDEEGLPVPGASIRVKGGNSATVSNQNGEFLLKKLDRTGVLVVSFIGYTTKEVKISTGYKDITIQPGNATLDEVQVVAYGKNTERYNRGSVNTITAEDISRQPVTNFLQALQGGLIPGLAIGQTNGYPSAPFEASIRGKNTLSLDGTEETNLTSPLYVIDGVPIASASNSNSNQGVTLSGLPGPAHGQSPFYAINPTDIESISILKDADATSIYGARAANGAILITTKSGKPGKASFDVRLNSGLTFQSRKFKLMDTETYLAMREEAFKNDGILETTSNAYDLKVWDKSRYTDWQKEILGTASAVDGQVGLSGGGERLTYRMNTGIHKETLPFPGDFAEQRNSFALSLNYFSRSKKLNLKFRSNYSYMNSRLPTEDPSNLIFLPPNAPQIFDNNGDRNIKGWLPGTFPSAVSVLKQLYKANTNFLSSNVGLSYYISPSLTFLTSIGYSFTNQNLKIRMPLFVPYLKDPLDEQNFFARNRLNTLIIEPGLTYKKMLGQGELETFLGVTLQIDKGKSTENGLYSYGTGIISGDLNLGASNESGGSYSIPTRFQSVYTRLNYDYLKKYLFTLNARVDGSSRYGVNKSLGVFGSVAFAWIISEEDFFKKLSPLLSFAKLRGSYGITGGNGDSDYLNISTSVGGIPYGGLPAYIRFKPANPDISPVIDKKLGAALDLGISHDRVLFSLAWYLNRTGNQLTMANLPAMTGYSSAVLNIPAEVQNSGMELTVRASPLKGRDLKWNTTLSINRARNRLIRYPNLEDSRFSFIYAIGESINRRALYHYLGIDPATGKYLYESNGNLISYIYKNADPQFSGALQNSFTYKKISLSFLFAFTRQMRQLNLVNGIPGALNDGLSNQALVPVPRFTTDGNRYDVKNYSLSDAYWVDASYIRLQNLSLEYVLRGPLTGTIKPSACKIFVQGQNLWTITGYKGSDVTRSDDLFLFPPRGIITAGLQLIF